MNSPDWSFQTEAIKNTVEKFLENKGIKLGIFIPTGGGKTQIGLKIALELLEKQYSSSNRYVLWVTHRTHLKKSVEVDLRKILSEQHNSQLRKFERRFRFSVINSVEKLIKTDNTNPVLIIIDEARGTAAPSCMLKMWCSNALPYRNSS